MNNAKTLEKLTHVYEDYLNKQLSTSELERRVGKYMSAIGPGNKTFTVAVVRSSFSEEFFGMRVFPAISELEIIAQNVASNVATFEQIYNKWAEIKDWYVEIDSDIFSRIINFNPREITAMTLHELGHVVYSDKPIERFYRAYKENYIRMTIADKATTALLYRLYSIPLALACTLHTVGSGKHGINVEIYADKYVIESGYGDDLSTALGKIVEQYGNNTRYTKDDNINKSELETSVKWASLNIEDMAKRKNELKVNSYIQAVKMKSGYMWDLCFGMMKSLGAQLRENYTGNAIESIEASEVFSPTFESSYSVIFNPKIYGAFETTLDSAKRNANNKAAMESRAPKIPSQQDIDYIGIEVDKIANHHDRTFVLDLIYNKIDEIESFREQFEYNRELKRKYDDKTQRMLDELEMLRQAVLQKRVFNNNQYKLYIKYPEGYEG